MLFFISEIYPKKHVILGDFEFFLIIRNGLDRGKNEKKLYPTKNYDTYECIF